MRRAHEVDAGIRSNDILQNFSKDQLMWIGAVAMAYNDAEAALHRVCGAFIDFPGPSYSITGRINNGTDGLKAIISEAIKALPLPSGADHLFAVTVNEGFSDLQSLRNAVIHGQLFDAHTGIAVKPGVKGKTRDVLLSPEALRALYERLVILRHEIQHLEDVVVAARRLRKQPEPHDQHRLRLEQLIEDAMAQCLDHQRRRLSLAPFPAFPERPAIFELVPPGSCRLFPQLWSRSHSWQLLRSPACCLRVVRRGSAP
jgi:hypothetical protein